MRCFIEENSLPESKLKHIKGIVYRSGNGRLITNPAQPVIRDIDQIPHPKRSLIGYADQSYIISSRGCPFRCVFCASSAIWPGYRPATAEYVVEEIEELVNHGVNLIRFNDDLFAVSKNRLRKIRDSLAQKDLLGRVAFGVSCRANLVNEELVGLLKEINVVSVAMGLESGSERVLDYLKGSVSVEDNAGAINLIKDAGIQANGFFVMGAPDETKNEIMETYKFIKASRIDFFDMYVLQPLPGTRLWDEAKEMGLVSNDMDWTRINCNFQDNMEKALLISRKLTRKEIIRLYFKFRRMRFYRILKALPFSPWFKFIPGVLWGIVRHQ
jgi:radical SAM superfamily enzyme YgiQ (UPF0313 family)